MTVSPTDVWGRFTQPVAYGAACVRWVPDGTLPPEPKTRIRPTVLTGLPMSVRRLNGVVCTKERVSRTFVNDLLQQLAILQRGELGSAG